MGAKVTHVLKVQVGEVDVSTKEETKTRAEWREIGKVIKFDGANGPWEELRISADVLNPVLAGLALKQGTRGSSEVRVIRSPIERGTSARPAARAADSDGGMEQEDAEW